MVISALGKQGAWQEWDSQIYALAHRKYKGQRDKDLWGTDFYIRPIVDTKCGKVLQTCLLVSTVPIEGVGTRGFLHRLVPLDGCLHLGGSTGEDGLNIYKISFCLGMK